MPAFLSIYNDDNWIITGQQLWACLTTYDITYKANSATSGTAPIAQTKAHDDDIVLAPNSGNLQRSGYVFNGWNTAVNGSGTDYAVGATYTLNDNLVLYAKWTLLPPPTPTGLSVSPGTCDWLNLSWNTTTGATGYNIYRNGTQLSSLPAFDCTTTP